MRTRIVAAAMLLALPIVSPGEVAAHHGIVNFDMNREVDVTGVVARLSFVNPHSWLYFDVTRDDGETVQWQCELRGATVLRRSGWTPEMFAVGTRVRITGAPDRFKPNTCYLGTVLFDDGTRVDRYGQIVRPDAAPRAATARSWRRPDGRPDFSGEWAGEQRVLTDPRGISGAFLPLSVARTVTPGAVPEGTQAFPGTRGTAVTGAEDPIDEFWNDRPSILPLTAEGAKVMEGFDGASTDNPRLRCEPTSILFDWTFESDVNRIEQDDRQIVLRYGSMGLERTIHLDRTAHPDGLTPSRAGHSIGRWEGDVLVVDTVGFEPGILSADGRLPHSDGLHVVERFSLEPERGALRRSWVAEDARYFEGEYTGADVVLVSDVPYEPTPCEDLSYKSPGAEPAPASASPLIAWTAASVGILALASWILFRRRGDA